MLNAVRIQDPSFRKGYPHSRQPNVLITSLVPLQHTVVHVDTMVSKWGDVVARVPEGNAKEHFRFNDGKVDPAGRLWVSLQAP
jgi:sugar lactone lactonase YvrE